MKHHSKIYLWKNPVLFIKDKFKTGFNQKGLYAISSLPSIPLIIGLIADFKNIWNISDNITTLTLLWFLFFYGLINTAMVFVIQRSSIRLRKEKKSFRILHKIICEGIRQYVTDKESSQTLSKDRIAERIEKILAEFNKQFMEVYHRPNITMTLKYLVNDQLFPIRVGDDKDNRLYCPEQKDDSFVYQSLNQTGNKLRYLYVKNINKTDKFENEVILNLVDIKARARDNYQTFIALPIRSGTVNDVVENSGVKVKHDLGILGIDMKEAYGFGNFESHELDILGCLTDLLALPTSDIIKISKDQTN